MKTIHICNENEARLLYESGLFHILVKEYVSLFSHPTGKGESGLLRIKELAKTGLYRNLTEIRNTLDLMKGEDVMLQYSSRNAILCRGGGIPAIWTKVSNVWIWSMQYDMKPDTSPFVEYRVSDQFNLKNDTEALTTLIMHDMWGLDADFYRITEDEVWKYNKNEYFNVTVYSAGLENTTGFPANRESIRKRLNHLLTQQKNKKKKITFGEF